MLESVLKQVDEQIARLQEAKRLLATENAPTRGRGGRPAKSATTAEPKPKGTQSGRKGSSVPKRASEFVRLRSPLGCEEEVDDISPVRLLADGFLGALPHREPVRFVALPS